jgi:cytochrome b6
MNTFKQKKWFRWLDERFNLMPLVDFMEHKDVPIHRQSLWYYMGGVTLFLFVIQVCSGILLLLYYQPGVDSSFESVRFIMTKVQFGWLFRSIHSWTANLMVFFIFVHMFSTFFTKAYKKPRELTWISGFLLLTLALGFGFSGYLLPWNELAFFATKVGTDIVGVIPFIGEAARTILRGGDDVTGGTLLRFYAFHVAMLPAVFTFILIIHLLLIQRQGMHEPESVNPASRRSMPFFPNFVLRDALLWMIVLNILLYLAVFFPWELGEKADAFASAPAGIRPEWYFMFMFQTLKFLPAHIWFADGEVVGILFFMLVAVAWLSLPFWAFRIDRNIRPRPMTILGIIAIVYIISMTILGYVL